MTGCNNFSTLALVTNMLRGFLFCTLQKATSESRRFQVTTYNFEYRYFSGALGMIHEWTCVGRDGAIQFHCRKSTTEEYHGGVEIHHRACPDYMGHSAPSQSMCHILKAPCWHDGSSLQATEDFIPYWKSGASHEKIFEKLRCRYEDSFCNSNDLIAENF